MLKSSDMGLRLIDTHSSMQGSPEVFVSTVHLSIVIHQHLGQLRVAIRHSKHQRSPEKNDIIMMEILNIKIKVAKLV